VPKPSLSIGAAPGFSLADGWWVRSVPGLI
jgi:hypothetical protein